MKKKIVTLCLVAALAVTAIGGTLAYFTDKTQVTSNTFTVGNVNIELDEADVDVYGVADGTNRTTNGNEYKLIPGHNYVKDPTVTVKSGSEESYVRMIVTVNKVDALKEVMPEAVAADGVFLLQNFVNGWDSTKWECTSATAEGVYEFRYYTTVDARTADVVLEDLFTDFTLPADLSNDEVAKLDNLSIDVIAHAIQADGFADANAAWAEF